MESEIAIKTGMIVKVRLTDGENTERVWAKVLATNMDAQTLDLEINNHPVVTPFKFGEHITMPVSYVLDIYTAEKYASRKDAEGGE